MDKKIALVTGGSRGLGKDMALALARRGLRLILTFKDNAQAADEVVKSIRQDGGEAIALRFDAGDVGSINDFTDEVRALAKKEWGVEHIDFLINNAGIGATIPMSEVTEADFDRLMNIHYKGV